jgi:hypothetical protein
MMIDKPTYEIIRSWIDVSIWLSATEINGELLSHFRNRKINYNQNNPWE